METTTFDTIAIKESLAQWKNILNDVKELEKYLSQGNYFQFELPDYALGSEVLHVYPGIHEETTYFFVIPAQYDNAEYAETFDQYTTVCKLAKYVGGGHTIPTDEAKLRMASWNTLYTQWIPKQVNSKAGMFQAFVVPTDDVEVESVYMFLALKATPAAEVSYEADLIVTNDNNEEVLFDDFVRPVPPYGQGSTNKDKFYLLP